MRKRLSFTAAAVLLLLMFVLAGGAALRESVTPDEVAHIGAGLSYIQKLDLRLNYEHPPLVKLVAGLPLAIRGTHADYASPQWTVAKSFLPAFIAEWTFGDWVLGRWNNAETTLLWARLPMLLMTLLLGWVLFRVGRRLGGDWGGLLALAAYASMPAFLAFGPLVLTDVAIALFTVLTLWTLGDLWRDPSPRNTRRFALALAGALLSKFSAGMLILAILAFVLSTRRWPLADQPADRAAARAWRKLRWRALRKGTWIAVWVLYAVYFVFSWNQPVDIPWLSSHGPILAAAARPLMPPWLFLRGLGWMLFTSVRSSFLLGHTYPHGVWFYYPVLLVLKSLPGFLGLLALTAALGLWHTLKSRSVAVVPERLSTHWRAIWVSLEVFTAISMAGPMDISIRHFSVPLALLALMLAPLPLIAKKLGRRMAIASAAVSAVLVASCLFTAVRQYPYFLQYSSPLAMGRPLYWLMSDSNTDWNQGLPEVEQFARRHGLTDVPLDNYGFSDARVTVPRSRVWDCQAPAEAEAGHWVFVSANMILDAHNCAWVMQHPHEPLAAGGMYAVRLPSPIPPAGAPGGPPLPSGRRIFLNFPVDMRVLDRELTEHPERIQPALDEMMATWQQAMNEQKKKARP